MIHILSLFRTNGEKFRLIFEISVVSSCADSRFMQFMGVLCKGA